MSSKRPKKPAAKQKPPPPSEEPSEGSLPENPELEAAVREAAEAVDKRAREAQAEGEPETGAPEQARADDELLLSEELETEFVDEEVERLRGELTEAKDRLLRLQADYENFRRRALREHQEASRYGHQNLVKDLLSVVDNLDRAVDHARQSGGEDLESFLHGVELVRRELLGTLSNHGVDEIDAMGKPFDPALHEAMGQMPDASVAPNTVVEVLQKGYQIRDRLVRPSRVVVARAPEGAEGGEDGEGGATE